MATDEFRDKPAEPGNLFTRGHVLVGLTIAGFDPSSGAGITADLKTFSAHGVYGLACTTALTIQSTMGVKRVIAIDPETVSDTLEFLADDIEISGIKIGMLASSGIVAAVADFLARGRVPRGRIVLDPVIQSSSGTTLLDEAGMRGVREHLLALAGWITPNVDELAVLVSWSAAGHAESNAAVTRAAVPEAALLLREKAAQAGNSELNIVVTGGHLDRPDDYFLEENSEAGVWISGEWVETSSTHGTGCAFSSALLGQLLRGRSGTAAVTGAKRYITEALRAAYPIGRGRGPMNHLFRLSDAG